MPPRNTPNPAARARRDLDELITAILDKLETDDPAWAASIEPRLKAARARVKTRSGKGRAGAPTTP